MNFFDKLVYWIGKEIFVLFYGKKQDKKDCSTKRAEASSTSITRL
jgi:hypothetical protein